MRLVARHQTHAVTLGVARPRAELGVAVGLTLPAYKQGAAIIVPAGIDLARHRQERGHAVGFHIPQNASQIAPTAGSVRLAIASTKADMVEYRQKPDWSE